MQFVRDTEITGGDETKTGYFAGIIVGVFVFPDEARPLITNITGICVFSGRMFDCCAFWSCLRSLWTQTSFTPRSCRACFVHAGVRAIQTFLVARRFPLYAGCIQWEYRSVPKPGQLLVLTLLIRRFEERYGRGKFSFSFSYICLIELTDIRLHKHRRNVFTSSVHVGFRRHAWVCSLLCRIKHGLRDVSSPLIGGTLADPAIRYPDTLGKIHILREFPYLLPCAAAGSLAFGAFIFGFLGLKEV
jgi:hypothetical protein